MKDRMLSTFSRLAARVGWRDVDEESPLDADDDASDDIRQHHSRRATQTESHLLQGELLLKESDSLRYLLRRPSLLSQSRPALLCFLHDVDQAAPAEPVRALTRHGPFACSGSPFLERFVVVAPQLPCSADAWCLYASAIEEIVEHEAMRHECDPSKIFLTGFSIGANGLFELANAQRRLWRGLWPVDPTRVANLESACPMWLSIGPLSRPYSKEWIRKLELKPSGRRNARRVWEDNGLDHALTARRAYEGNRVYDWLLSQGS